MDFQDKRVLITGASSGVGRACAVEFGKRGARLVLTGRSEERLRRTAAEAGSRNAEPLPADLADRDSLARLCDSVIERLGGVDLLVNSAGVGMYVPSFLSEPAKLRRLFEVNLFAPLELTRRLLPVMPAGGAVVNISSIAGMVPLPWLTHYSVSKSALNCFSDALRMELDGSGIHVLCVCPGYVETPFREHVLQGEIPESVAAQRRFQISAERCAADIVRGLEKRKRIVVTPPISRLLAIAAWLFPGIVQGRMARMNPASHLLPRP